MKLNLGSGNRPLEGYVNWDKEPSVVCELLVDLEVLPWPAANNSCEEIMMSHVLEHLGQTPTDFCRIMKEIYRILSPGGTLIVKVPHPRSEGYLGDPTHVRPITPQLMSLFGKAYCAYCKERDWPNTPLAIYLDIDLELKDTNFNLTPRWGEKFKQGNVTKEELDYAIESFNNVVDEITMTLVKVA